MKTTYNCNQTKTSFETSSFRTTSEIDRDDTFTAPETLLKLWSHHAIPKDEIVFQHYMRELRPRAVAWIFDAIKFPWTIYSAINLLDRFFSCCDAIYENVILYAAACLLMASKVEQVCPIDMCNFSDSQIKLSDLTLTERQIFERLGGDVSRPSALTFMRYLNQTGKSIPAALLSCVYYNGYLLTKFPVHVICSTCYWIASEPGHVLPDIFGTTESEIMQCFCSLSSMMESEYHSWNCKGHKNHILTLGESYDGLRKIVSEKMNSQQKISQRRTHFYSNVASSSSVVITKKSNYERLCNVGEGSYGEVYKVKDVVTQEVFAYKKTIDYAYSSEGIPCSFLRECSNLLCLSHPNIVKLRAITENALVMDFSQTNLKVYYSSKNYCCGLLQLTIAKQILAGTAYMHSMGIIHRDIKPENILVDYEGAYQKGRSQRSGCNPSRSRRGG